MERTSEGGARRATSVLVLAALLLGGAGPASGEPAVAARKVVEDTLAQIITILNEKGASEDDRRDRIANIAYERFDFDTMGKLVIARPWRKFTPEQRKEFIEEFKTHLARSYGRRLSRYEGVQVKVTSEVPEQRGDVTVNSEVVGGQFDGAELSYRMREVHGQWLVIDVIIEGVSLVGNFRSQFRPIVTEGGATLLLKRLRDKNDALQSEIEQSEADPRPETGTAG